MMPSLSGKQWVPIASWHIVREVDGRGGYITLCGKHSAGPPAETYPDGAMTCESCLRLRAKGQGQSSSTMHRFSEERAAEAI